MVLIFGAALSAAENTDANTTADEISAHIKSLETRVTKLGVTDDEIVLLMTGLSEVEILLRTILYDVERIEEENKSRKRGHKQPIF